MLAVIGTAGRDKTVPMTRKLWDSMCTDLAARLEPTDVLVSGGAAWADHIASARTPVYPCAYRAR